MTAKRIENIIKCSKLNKDDIHQKPQYDISIVLGAHKSCVDKYVHPTRVKRAVKRQQMKVHQGYKTLWRGPLILVLSFPGIATILAFNSRTTKDLEDDDSDDYENLVTSNL